MLLARSSVSWHPAAPTDAEIFHLHRDDRVAGSADGSDSVDKSGDPRS
jgi:hypothetical protein